MVIILSKFVYLMLKVKFSSYFVSNNIYWVVERLNGSLIGDLYWVLGWVVCV